MEVEYVGVIDGMDTWLVRDETGQVIGMNQTAVTTEEVNNGMEAPISEVENN